MGKTGKIIGVFLLVLGIVCIGMYFIYSKGIHTVRFDSNGGSSVTSQIVKDNELASNPDVPTKDGYEFNGWYLNNNKYDFNTAVTSDLTLVAKWDKVYNISVKLENYSYTTEVVENEKINISTLNIPEREGYVIKLYNGDIEYNLDNLVTSDMDLNAKYVALKSFTVKFDSNGGSKVNDVKVWEGSLVTAPIITRTNYTLDGWYLNNILYDFDTPITSNITLVAKWRENGKIAVTFESDGKVYKTINVFENSVVTKPENPKKTGYVFEKWLLDGNEFDFKTKITSEITLVASYREAKKYKVSFDSDGGTSIKDVTVYEGDKVSKPTNPTKNNYKFKEWQLSGKTYDFNSVVTKDITLKAIWEEEYFKVSFDSDGGSFVQSQLIKSGNKVVIPPNPTKEGSTFVEWRLGNVKYDFDSVVTKEITLKAIWQED